MHRIELLRLDYLFSLLIPCFFAIYNSGTSLLSHSKLLISWILLALAMNIMNDIFDKDRKIQLSDKALTALTLIAVLLGLVISTNLILAMIFLLIVSIYNWRMKKIPIIATLSQVIAYVLIPYLSIWKIDETLLFLCTFAFMGQAVHEVADKESFSKVPKNKEIILIIIFVVLGLAVHLSFSDIVYSPAILIAVLTLYGVARGIKKEMKDVGLLIGNLCMLFLFAFIL